MAPIRSDSYAFTFDHRTLEVLRKRLGLTQAALAEELDVPVNTVSRWETGANSPDANALAAMYSIAKERGVNAQFFTRRMGLTTKPTERTKLVLAWDFQNIGIKDADIEEEWEFIESYLDLSFPKTRSARLLHAYAMGWLYSDAPRRLRELGFIVPQTYRNADPQLIEDVLAACWRRPQRTVAVIASNDGGYSELVLELRQKAVDVYVMGTDECSERLRKAVGSGGFVHWDQPYVVTECVEVIKELNGKSITKSEFGSLCRQRLDESEVYPDDVGFSRRNPYGSLLRWLQGQGVISVADVPGRPKFVTIKLLR